MPKTIDSSIIPPDNVNMSTLESEKLKFDTLRLRKLTSSPGSVLSGKRREAAVLSCQRGGELMVVQRGLQIGVDRDPNFGSDYLSCQPALSQQSTQHCTKKDVAKS